MNVFPHIIFHSLRSIFSIFFMAIVGTAVVLAYLMVYELLNFFETRQSMVNQRHSHGRGTVKLMVRPSFIYLKYSYNSTNLIYCSIEVIYCLEYETLHFLLTWSVDSIRKKTKKIYCH